DADGAGVGERQLHAAHGERLRARRFVRRRHRAGRMASDRLAAHVDLRRQDGSGVRHRVPGSQVRPAVRNHTVVDLALHDGHADGEASQGVYGLDLHQGAYLELDAMVTSSFGVVGRGEFRDAFVWLGDQRAYLTKVWRATLGLRWVLTPRAVVKAEYLLNGE